MSMSDNQLPTHIYVGTYTKTLPQVPANSEGIYLYRLDPESGALGLVRVTPGVVNPSYLALSPDQRFLYAVNEVLELDGQVGGGISAFAVNPANGELTFINRQSTQGGDPCHLSVDDSGRWVGVANYTGGSVALFAANGEGGLGPASDFHQHAGGSILPRQTEPHAHSINLDPANRFALVCDLGLDQVLTYELDRNNGKLVRKGAVSVSPGSGPRHFAFHPNGRNTYVINEIASTITALTYDAATGHLTAGQTVSTLPADFVGENSTADIHVHPNGKFVYGSNRGHDSIAIFAIDEASGDLTAVGHESTRGRTPRNFAIDPTGQFLFAANQNTANVATFRIDPERGTLSFAAESSVPTPVCLKFAWL